jgi:hypothetical protein
MTKIQEIAKAVADLPPEDLAEFRAWFEAFDAEQFDKKLERDERSGKLDRMAEAALAEHRSGRTREL